MLAAAVALTYGRVLGFDFVAWDDPTAYFNLAIALANTGDTDGARRNAERAGRLAVQQNDTALAAQVQTFVRALRPTT